ncbi:unnamed protein product [Aphis gossypii]|nr:unnamed protein product [Aphis gossypii]
MGNANKTLLSSSFNNDVNNFEINDIFPIEMDVHHEEFESKIKNNENDFKSLLLQLKVWEIQFDVSCQECFTIIFYKSILLMDLKKKKRFASLESYRIIIDILHTHVKYEMTPEKEIDHEIGTWLAHAHFRIKKKMISDTNKNN